MTNKIPLLIDTDPGVDDALAILMAFNSPDHDVVGLTIAAGNVGLDYTVRNALKLCEVAERADVPVFAGAPQPLLHRSEDAAFVHGRDGFGDIGYAPAARQPEAEHAALAILRLSHEHAGRLMIVALGPLTNIALALKLDPTLPQRVTRLVVMGGAVTGHGNITPSAEFNTGFDPEAAHIVFEAFPQFDLCDWEANLRHGFPHEAMDQWLQVDSPRARFYDAISAHTRRWSREKRGSYWHSADGYAMACALAPEGIEATEARPLAVQLGQGLARGLSIVDWNRMSGRPDNARIVQTYDGERYQAMIRAALAAG
ncbi:nucleoside hydrolase [Solilutibacter silvestris]|uniref:Inosine-uridine nucleoside N-ribohydrolase n=1 Tax=Solilutibacter silvestris TaxID=1645665 RepID=A0A2K1PX27_9GAMM|nr:nucleoside hydrolase [Lysobacter silvestris]PNS07342.1 Inosine-uridine nucleoside N-ribohydrolase [Lysobacter silvestris]